MGAYMQTNVRPTRDARFRVKVVTAYNCICALNAYGLAAVTAGSVVEVPEA
jgi:predicted restriction endonuclease